MSKCYARVEGLFAKVLTDEERFMLYVEPEPNSGCWLWTGQVDKDGYGKFTTGVYGNQKHYRAHRWITNAPAGKVAMHRCDNPPCVNPDHIQHGNQSQNITDCVKRGRHASQRQNSTPVPVTGETSSTIAGASKS